MNSAVFGVALSMAIVFAVLAAAASAATEAVSRFLGLRGEYLLRGLRTLIDSSPPTFRTRLGSGTTAADRKQKCETIEASASATADVQLHTLLSHPIVQAQGNRGTVDRLAGNIGLSANQRRQLPSYLSARSFAAVVIDTLVPDGSGSTTLTGLRAGAERLSDARLGKAVVGLIDQSEGDLTRFRASLESWYDDHMARVSGWYKRHVRWITLGVAAVFVLIFNLSAVRLASALYLDDPVRATIVSQAEKVPCASAAQTCLQQARTEVESLERSGLPIGWSTSAKCVDRACGWTDRYDITEPGRDAWHNLLHVLEDLLGYLLMVAATVPGARFWFDALSKLNVLRSTGPKPSQTPSSGLYVVPMTVGAGAPSK